MANAVTNSTVAWAWRVLKLALSCALVLLVEKSWQGLLDDLWQAQIWHEIVYFSFLLGIFVILPVSIVVSFTVAKNRSIIGVTVTDLVVVVLILLAVPLLLFWPWINDIYFPGQLGNLDYRNLLYPMIRFWCIPGLYFLLSLLAHKFAIKTQQL